MTATSGQVIDGGFRLPASEAQPGAAPRALPVALRKAEAPLPLQAGLEPLPHHRRHLARRLRERPSRRDPAGGASVHRRVLARCRVVETQLAHLLLDLTLVGAGLDATEQLPS